MVITSENDNVQRESDSMERERYAKYSLIQEEHQQHNTFLLDC